MPANENGSTHPHVPTVLWAQRDDKIFLTVAVEDIDKPEIRIETNSLFFKYLNQNFKPIKIKILTFYSKWCCKKYNL